MMPQITVPYPGPAGYTAFADEPYIRSRRRFWISGIRSGSQLPTLLQILKGQPPSNVGPVLFARPPYRAYKYSGGGVVVMQVALTDLLAEPFDQIMQALGARAAGHGRQHLSATASREPCATRVPRTRWRRSSNGRLGMSIPSKPRQAFGPQRRTWVASGSRCSAPFPDLGIGPEAGDRARNDRAHRRGPICSRFRNRQERRGMVLQPWCRELGVPLPSARPCARGLRRSDHDQWRTGWPAYRRSGSPDRCGIWAAQFRQAGVSVNVEVRRRWLPFGTNTSTATAP